MDATATSGAAGDDVDGDSTDDSADSVSRLVAAAIDDDRAVPSPELWSWPWPPHSVAGPSTAATLAADDQPRQQQQRHGERADDVGGPAGAIKGTRALHGFKNVSRPPPIS